MAKQVIATAVINSGELIEADATSIHMTSPIPGNDGVLPLESTAQNSFTGNKVTTGNSPFRFRSLILISTALVISLLMLMTMTGCSGTDYSQSSKLTRLGDFENGTLYRTNGDGGSGTYNVLVLKGNWREMGRQYGFLLTNEMDAFYRKVVTENLMGDRGVAYEEIREDSEHFYEQMYPYEQELVKGMAETSGFSFEKLKIITALVHLAGCSSMAAWGDYTGSGPLVVGRNWDIGGPYASYRKFLTVVIYNPSDSTIGVADINFVGTISLQTGLNSKGIFLDIQNGQRSDPTEVKGRRLPTHTLFDFLRNSATLDELNSRMLDHANLPSVSLIINAADAREDRVYEWATYDVKSRSGNGLIASSNHFIEPTWTGLPAVPPGAEGDYSKERLTNLLVLGKLNKGFIDAGKMMNIFDTLYPEGGATFSDYTVFQVVAVPAERTIWLKAIGYSGWEGIDLRPLFSN